MLDAVCWVDSVILWDPTLLLLDSYIGWNDVTYLWSQYDRHFVGQHRRTVRSLVVKIRRIIRMKLNQLVYENVRIIAILLRKWCPNKKRFAELDLQHGGKTAGIDMIWRNYVTVTLCIAQHSYTECDTRLETSQELIRRWDSER